MRDKNYYTDLANDSLTRIEALKEDSKIHSNDEEKREKMQNLVDAYQQYQKVIKPQLENSGIEYHKYNSRIENIIKSI